jgi:hypothetical protein
VGISTIKKFTSGRGWGITPRGLSYKAFNLPSHPDHKYIWFRVGISVTFVYTDSFLKLGRKHLWKVIHVYDCMLSKKKKSIFLWKER